MKKPAEKTTPLTAVVLRQLLDIYDHPCFLLDEAGIIQDFNQHARQVVNRPRDLNAGQPLKEVLNIEDRILEDVLSVEDADPHWRDRICSLDDDGQHVFKLRARPVELENSRKGLLVVVEEAGSWEERYRHVLEGAPVLFIETSREGKILYGGKDLARLLGYGADELPSDNFFKLIADDGEQQLLKSIWTEVCEAIEGKGCEITLDSVGGGRSPFWASLFPVVNAGGSVVGVRGTLRDMGTQKDLAHALESAEERFKVLFSESSDPIMILSMKGEIMSANPALERIAGVASEDLFMGEKEWKDIVHPEDLELFLKSLETCAAENETQVVEFRVIHSEHGKPTWFELRFSILHDEEDQAKGIMAVARNIERRKQEEQRLRDQAKAMEQRHQRSQLLISKLKSFFTHISELPPELDGFVQGVCEILYEMYAPLRVGVFLDEEEPRHFSAGKSIPPELLDPRGVPGLSHMYEQVIETSFPLYSNTLHEQEAFKDDPFVKELELKTYLGAPLRDSTGKIRGVLSVLDNKVRDFDSLDVELITVAALHIASRLRAEEHEVVKRELEENLQQAQKMEAIGKLAGGIAHDFNNILSGILGFSSLLLAKAEKGTREYGNLELIEKSAVRMSEMTKGLLAFSKKKHFTKTPVELPEVISEVLTLVKPSLSKKVVVQHEVPRSLPPILGDATQLKQVLTNLCINAGDAMSEKGGVLKIRSASRPLTARERSVMADAGDGEYVCITVSDTGSGMPPEVQKNIFDPYFTTKKDRGGTGLGLSVVYGIVTGHQGFITVDSTEGVGTVFKLYFPVHRETEKPEGEGEKPAEVLSGDEKILVVDDEDIVRQTAMAILKGHEYRVEGASSGMEAEEIMLNHTGEFNLVLLDMVMPEMDGVATFHAIRKIDKKIPILLTSGFSEEERSGQLLKLGAKGMLHKPYKSDELPRRIRQIFDADKEA